MKSLFSALLTAGLGCVIVFASCSRRPALPLLTNADSIRIRKDNLEYRMEKDAFFAHDPHSPFVRDTSVRYHGINWVPIDPAFRGESVLHTYADPETVLVMGTKGEARRQVRCQVTTSWSTCPLTSTPKISSLRSSSPTFSLAKL